MERKDYILLAKKNLKGRRKRTVLQTSLLVAALFVILVTNMITYGLDYFLTTQINCFYDGRIIKVSSISEEGIEKTEGRTEEIQQVLEGEQCVEAVGSNYYTGTTTEDIREGESLFLELYDYDDTYRSYLMNGCRTPDDGEIIIPKYIYGDEVYESVEATDYIDGEQWIGRDITLQYDDRRNVRWDEEQDDEIVLQERTFRVIGVFDNIEYGTVDAMGFVSQQEAMEINRISGPDYEVNDMVVPSTEYHVLLRDSKDKERIIQKLVKAGFAAKPGVYEEESAYLPFVRFARFVGNVVGIVVLLWACFNLLFYYQKDIKKRSGELGLMKAIGYTSQDIRIIFLTETIITGSLALVIAVVSGWIVAMAGNYGIQKYLNPIWGKIHFSIRWIDMVLMVAMVAGIVLINYVLLGKKIQKIQPCETLKGE